MTQADEAPPDPSTERAPEGVSDATVLELRLLGEPAWQGGSGPATPLAAKDAALLARLALEGPQPRSLLHALLWPEASAERAASNLRQRSSRLNRAAKCPMVQLGDRLRLGPQVRVDATAPEQLDTARLLAAGELLSGIDLGGLGELDLWLQAARQRVGAAVAEVLAERAEALERDGRLHEALTLGRRIVELAPLGEHGWRRLMRLHYLRGDRGAAQEAFWKLRALLRDELGIRPSAETAQLMQTIETAVAGPTAARRAVPTSLRRPPLLVGRDGAWQAMAAAWQAGQPFLLVGEAGLGKTRLLEDFASGLAGVFGTRALPGDDKAPYALLGRVLLGLKRQFAPALAPGVCRELARLHPDFGEAPPEPAQGPVLWRAAAGLLSAARDSGLRHLLLDDLHNADRASIEVLRWLCASPESADIAVGLASRPGSATDTELASWLQDSQRPVRVDLAPLTLAQLGGLLASLALPELVDRQLARQLHRHAGGHPLYTLATLQEMVAGSHEDPGTALPRPGSVEALLDARVAALPADVRELLGVAAVAGADLTADRAARMLGLQLMALSDGWARLEAANVLQGESFSHDLMHDAALRAVPRGIRQSLHRKFAALLGEEPAPAAARVAWHWEQSQRWGEAGRWWHRAGEAARAAGRLAEQIALFENAARCHAEAGDGPARFEALHARLEALLLRHGGQRVLAVLPELETLAADPATRLRCRLARAHAWLDLHRANEAAAETEAAVREAADDPAQLGDAGALHAQALALLGRLDEALPAAVQAVQAADALGDGPQRLRALDALRYVHYARGEVLPAIGDLHHLKALAESIGLPAEAAAADGNLAALLAVVGDVPATYAHARRCGARHREIGLAEDSTIGSVNHIVLGAAAAALGRFDEALEALQAAVDMTGGQAAPAARAKARITLANTWLLLGRPELASQLLEEIAAGVPVGMQIQAQLVRALACECAGSSPRRHLEAIGRLARSEPEPPLMQSTWLEWSYQGPADAVVDRLRRVASNCESLGLHGTARSLRWRELVRTLAGPASAAPDAIHALALALLPHAVDGMSAKCHPPLVLRTLADAFQRVGDADLAARCRGLALPWIEQALARVPADHQQTFLRMNAAVRGWVEPGTSP